MTEVLDAVNAAFDALFYGSGMWFGILLILGMCIGLMLKWKYSGVLTVPVTTFLGLDYLNRDLGWPAVIMFFATIFTVIYVIMQKKKG
jgi:hypothetical protein